MPRSIASILREMDYIEGHKRLQPAYKEKALQSLQHELDSLQQELPGIDTPQPGQAPQAPAQEPPPGGRKR